MSYNNYNTIKRFDAAHRRIKTRFNKEMCEVRKSIKFDKYNNIRSCDSYLSFQFNTLGGNLSQCRIKVNWMKSSD